MVFKRRDPRGTYQVIRETLYPRGGWGRAVNYIYYRLRRLPDPPHRIARGVAAGMFITCTPFFGLHFVLSALTAWLIRGNIVAAMLTTLVGNPVTFPVIAAVSLKIGHWMLGTEAHIRLHEVSHSFASAAQDLWWNLHSLRTGDPTHWTGLAEFYQAIFLPYMLGGTVLGLVTSGGLYAATHPVIEAYQRRRARSIQLRLQDRLKARRTA